MRSLFVALAAASILVFGASRASADVENVPPQCQTGIGKTGFDTGRSAEHDIVMRLWRVHWRGDFHRANQFIDNVTQTVLSALPSVTVDENAFIGCRFVGMVDGATRAISDIARDQLIVCTNEGLDIGEDLAKFNCALTHVLQGVRSARGPSYVTIDVECRVNVDLGCRTGFDRYLQDNRFSTCSWLAENPSDATSIKNAGCNLSRETVH